MSMQHFKEFLNSIIEYNSAIKNKSEKNLTEMKLKITLSTISKCDKEDLGKTDKYGHNILHLAARCNWSKVADKLIQLMDPNDINSMDKKGHTPLNIASIFNSGGVLEVMYENYDHSDKSSKEKVGFLGHDILPADEWC